MHLCVCVWYKFPAKKKKKKGNIAHKLHFKDAGQLNSRVKTY